MDSQASWNETTDQGLENSPEWQNVPKPHGEKCHDPARLDKIIGKWRESKGLATKPEKEARQAAASSADWSKRFDMLDQLAEKQAALQKKIDSKQGMRLERKPVDCSERPGTRPRRIRQASEAPEGLEAKPVQDEPAREHGSTEARPPMSLEAEMASASQDSRCGVSGKKCDAVSVSVWW